jgi:hypothetical protein
MLMREDWHRLFDQGRHASSKTTELDDFDSPRRGDRKVIGKRSSGAMRRLMSFTLSHAEFGQSVVMMCPHEKRT